MPDTTLIAGPYTPPLCRVGDWLDDEIDGQLEVGGWTAAPISWPRRKKTGRASLILTAELARAVRTESVAAICHHWGVRPTKVWLWRQALGVETTAGSQRIARRGVPADAAARGRARAAQADARAKMAESKRSRPVTPEMREAMSAMARRPRAQFGAPGAPGARWSDRELAFLGRWHGEISNGEIAQRLHRSKTTVDSKVHQLGLSKRQQWSADAELYLAQHYESMTADEIARRLGRSRAAVMRRAGDLGVRGTKQIRWSDEDDRLLRDRYGRLAAREIAMELGKSERAIYSRAHALGIKRGAKEPK